MNGFFASARRLASASASTPTESDLRRAVSTAYYAVFTELAELCADHLAGSEFGRRDDENWRRVFRSLDHGRLRAVIREEPEVFKSGIAVFAETFERLKGLRHTADYDPAPFPFDLDEVHGLLDDAETARALLKVCPDQVRRQLAFILIVPRRRV